MFKLDEDLNEFEKQISEIVFLLVFSKTFNCEEQKKQFNNITRSEYLAGIV